MASASPPLTRTRALAPVLVLAGAVAAIAGLALGGTGSDPLVGHPAPQFSRPRLEAGPEFSPAQMRGQVWVLNVWASWCAACREEHPRIAALARAHGVSVVGLDSRDAPQAARAWLLQMGDPFVAIALDPDGEVARSFGMRGLPETFVIDRAGTVRLRHAGALTAAALERRILPAVREWEGR